MKVDGYRTIGRPRLWWNDAIRKYMKGKQVKIEEAQDRRTWKSELGGHRLEGRGLLIGGSKLRWSDVIKKYM